MDFQYTLSFELHNFCISSQQGNAGDEIAKAVLTQDNAEKISQTLCRMRGVPLKLGQALR